MCWLLFSGLLDPRWKGTISAGCAPGLTFSFSSLKLMTYSCISLVMKATDLNQWAWDICLNMKPVCFCLEPVHNPDKDHIKLKSIGVPGCFWIFNMSPTHNIFQIPSFPDERDIARQLLHKLLEDTTRLLGRWHGRRGQGIRFHFIFQLDLLFLRGFKSQLFAPFQNGIGCHTSHSASMAQSDFLEVPLLNP